VKSTDYLVDCVAMDLLAWACGARWEPTPSAALANIFNGGLAGISRDGGMEWWGRPRGAQHAPTSAARCRHSRHVMAEPARAVWQRRPAGLFFYITVTYLHSRPEQAGALQMTEERTAQPDGGWRRPRWVNEDTQKASPEGRVPAQPRVDSQHGSMAAWQQREAARNPTSPVLAPRAPAGSSGFVQPARLK
jgi:hypothetical protein